MPHPWKSKGAVPSGLVRWLWAPRQQRYTPLAASLQDGTRKSYASPVTVKLTDLPRGPVELDDYGNPIENVYVRKVERVNGALQNTVIATFPRVSQFWKYDPAAYLRQPLYTRQTVPPPPQ